VRVAVTGASGQLGAAIVSELSRSHDVSALGRAELDVTDDRAIAAVTAAIRPDAIVNCAAYTDVDRSEDHPVDALNVNAYAVRALARAARNQGAALVHYSTDFVFDGTATAPYTEEAAPGPRSAYAVSKLLGEWFATDAPRAYVLRVESLFGRAPNGPASRGSAAGILDGLLAGASPRVFEDRTISPTYVIDAARATRELLEKQAPTGLYHCVNSGACTWFDFALELARQLRVEPRVTPVRLGDVQLRARRPRYCALSNEKLRRAGIEMPSWQDALARHVRAIDAQIRARR